MLIEGGKVDYYTFLGEIIYAFIDTGPTTSKQRRVSSGQPAYILLNSLLYIICKFSCPYHLPLPKSF